MINGSLSYYYLNHGFRMLLIDERAHGESEGTYIGFGTMDRPGRNGMD